MNRRPDYCPIGNEPCQSLCDTPCGTVKRRTPLNEAQIMKCIAEAGCYGTVKMSFESGPYSIDRPSLNATKFASAIEKAHGIAPEQGGNHG